MRIGMISSPVPGHINPMSTLGRELKKRGHEIFFFNIEDTREKITKEGHHFVPIGNSADEFPAGSWEKFWVPLSEKHGISVVLKTIKLHTKLSNTMVKEIPILTRDLKLDGLLIDQVQFQGKAIAKLASIPFISVACALHMDKDLSFCAPPATSKRKYGEDFITKALNRLEYAVIEKAAAPLISSGNPDCKSADETYSELAQIFPMPKGADFPAVYASQCIHYVGSFLDEDRPQAEFDFDQLNGKPLIYASLGTLQNGMWDVYQKILDACGALDAQIILSLGQWRERKSLPFKIPSNAMVVGYAPQLELIKRANLVITHAGMNTAFETLAHGVPMVAVPITNDQPAVARRLERIGAAEVIPIEKLTSSKLEAAVKKVLGNANYKNNARKFAEEAKNSGGVKRAADIVEEKFQSQHIKSNSNGRNNV